MNEELKLSTITTQAELFRKLMTEVHAFNKQQETLPEFVASNEEERLLAMGEILNHFIIKNQVEV